MHSHSYVVTCPDHESVGQCRVFYDDLDIANHNFVIPSHQVFWRLELQAQRNGTAGKSKQEFFITLLFESVLFVCTFLQTTVELVLLFNWVSWMFQYNNYKKKSKKQMYKFPSENVVVVCLVLVKGQIRTLLRKHRKVSAVFLTTLQLGQNHTKPFSFAVPFSAELLSKNVQQTWLRPDR